ncbi:MAG TPA: DUF6089 family protein [Catalimonadaceae bacterium]|nr:DUF6089 family protein [Catalimonadaceae bacterium]
MKRFPIFFRGLFALIFFASSAGRINAQRYEFGGGLGVLNYKGDLNPHLNILLSKPGIQVFARYNFSMAVVGRFNFLYGKLSGDGSLSPNLYISQLKPNLFSTDIFEFSGLMEYNFFNYRNPKNRFIFGSPYLFGGPAVFIFSPDPVEKNSSVSMVQPALFVGFGYKHQVGQFWNIGIEFGGRFSFTDYLDNVSDREVLTNMQRGNVYDKDMYTFFGINLSYTIKEVICPFDYQQSDEKK